MLNLTFPETDEMVDLYYGRLLWSDYLIEMKNLQLIKTRRTNDVIYNYESETSFVHSPLSEIEQNLNLDNYPLQKKALNVTLESLMSLDFPDEGLTTDEIHRVIKLVERLDALKKIMINTTSL